MNYSELNKWISAGDKPADRRKIKVIKFWKVKIKNFNSYKPNIKYILGL